MHWILCFFCYIVGGTLNTICIHAICSFEDSTYPPTYLGDGWALDCWFTQQCLNWCIGYRDYIESSLSCNIGRTVVAIAVFQLLFSAMSIFQISRLYSRGLLALMFSLRIANQIRNSDIRYTCSVYTLLCIPTPQQHARWLDFLFIVFYYHISQLDVWHYDRRSFVFLWWFFSSHISSRMSVL